jgi:hypothetical protein
METKMIDLNQFPPEVQRYLLKIREDHNTALARAKCVFGIDAQFMHLVELKMRDHFNENYPGEHIFSTLINMACNPRTRGFARELRLIMQDFVIKIRDMRANGYSDDATEAMLMLMI